MSEQAGVVLDVCIPSGSKFYPSAFSQFRAHVDRARSATPRMPSVSDSARHFRQLPFTFGGRLSKLRPKQSAAQQCWCSTGASCDLLGLIQESRCLLDVTEKRVQTSGGFGDRAQFTDMAHRCDAAGVWREKADERVGVVDQFQICHDACK